MAQKVGEWSMAAIESRTNWREVERHRVTQLVPRFQWCLFQLGASPEVVVRHIERKLWELGGVARGMASGRVATNWSWALA